MVGELGAGSRLAGRLSLLRWCDHTSEVVKAPKEQSWAGDPAEGTSFTQKRRRPGVRVKVTSYSLWWQFQMSHPAWILPVVKSREDRASSPMKMYKAQLSNLPCLTLLWAGGGDTVSRSPCQSQSSWYCKLSSPVARLAPSCCLETQVLHCSPVVKLEEDTLSPREANSGKRLLRACWEVRGLIVRSVCLWNWHWNSALCSPGKVYSCCFLSCPGPPPWGHPRAPSHPPSLHPNLSFSLPEGGLKVWRDPWYELQAQAGQWPALCKPQLHPGNHVCIHPST